MLPTFIIGLREGLEAALIVGIVAGFLARNGRRDAIRSMWLGVAVAVAVALAVGVALQVTAQSLPQRAQEGLETVIGCIAVLTVTAMIVWIRRHGPRLRTDLESAAASALARGSAGALVAMAFLAVLREGFETSVFLLATFQASQRPALAGLGAVLGIGCAALLGVAIYRGAARIDLARFFRITGVVLVLIAAGLVASALHSAHEAGWLNVGQWQVMNLSAIVRPGSIVSALLTGVLGWQPYPTLIELIGWLVFAIPMLVFVLMPRRSGRPWRVPWRRHGAPAARAAAGGVAAAALACLLLASCSGAEQAADAAGTTTVMVSLTPQGCQPKPASISAGPVTFNVSNDGADAVSEAELLAGQRIMGEKENLAPGLSGTFSLRLNAGAYQVYCPGAERSRWTLRVTGSAAPQAADLRPLLRVAVGQYHDFVLSQASELVRRTDRFVAAVKAGDVGQAKLLFAPARYPYEQIEPVAESFGDLDPRIDARINDVADPASWTGFHRLEKALWVDGSVKGMAPVADQLKADVARLHQLVSTESYQPAQLANGASELLDEVATSKVTGEEDRYSHTDLSDFEANVIGAKEAFEMLRPALDRRDPALGATIEDRFEAVITALAPYLSDTSHDGSGYVSYDTVSTAERRTLAQQVDALAEPLSRVASTIA